MDGSPPGSPIPEILQARVLEWGAIAFSNTYIYNGLLLNHKKNEIVPFTATWVDLETIMLSEVNQKEKSKYYTILLTCINRI